MRRTTTSWILAATLGLALGCGGSSVQGGTDAAPGQDSATPDPDGATTPDAAPGPCGGECALGTVSACTCGIPDPCGWQANGTCDDQCRVDFGGSHFSDLDDCDLDNDGLYDTYEAELALRFEPYLWIAASEEGYRDDRLPHFALEPFATDLLSIFYAQSYFEDYGEKDLGGLSSHLGDTEFVIIELIPDPMGDWMIDRIFLSAHYNSPSDSSGWYAFTDFEQELTPDGNAHPVVYVAEWKHANYRSLASCDAGGTLGSDHCDRGELEPLGIAADRNVGNPQNPLIDDVTLTGNVEYYFTDIRFCGWRVASPDNSGRGSCTGQSSTYGDWISDWLTGNIN